MNNLVKNILIKLLNKVFQMKIMKILQKNLINKKIKITQWKLKKRINNNNQNKKKINNSILKKKREYTHGKINF